MKDRTPGRPASPRMTLTLKVNPIPVTNSQGDRIGWATIREDGSGLIEYDDGTKAEAQFFTENVQIRTG